MGCQGSTATRESTHATVTGAATGIAKKLGIPLQQGLPCALSETVAWHIQAHQMTGDPLELHKLQKAAALYPAGTSEYTVGTSVYNVSNMYSSLVMERGEIVAVLVIGRNVCYYLRFSPDRYEVVPEADVSYYRPIVKHPSDLYRQVDVEIDNSTPLQTLRSGPTRGSPGAKRSPNAKRSSSIVAGDPSRRGFGIRGVKEAQPKASGGVGEGASSKLPPSAAAAMRVAEDVRYLVLPADHSWQKEEAVKELPPSFLGMDSDVYEMMYGAAGSVKRGISSRTTSSGFGY